MRTKARCTSTNAAVLNTDPNLADLTRVDFRDMIFIISGSDAVCPPWQRADANPDLLPRLFIE